MNDSPLTCVACGAAPDGLPRYLVRDMPGDQGPPLRYSIRVCGVCGTGRTEPFPSVDELSRLYDSYASRPSLGEDRGDILVRWRCGWGRMTGKVFYSTRGGIFRLYRRALSGFLVPRVTMAPLYTDILRGRGQARPLRLLDVGCGSCEHMQFARAAGIEAVGLEVDERAAAAARSLGLDVRAAMVGSLVGKERFDMVRYSHTLEHLIDPCEDLRQARQLLGSGGYVMIAVPQIPSAVTLLLRRHAHYHLPYHLHHFTRQGLVRLLDRAGYDVLGIKSKSNSVLAQSLSRWANRPGWINRPAFRLLCIAGEIVVDAVGFGDAMECHAVAR